MSKIIQLRGDPHEEAQRLLPWFVNDTLDAEERAAVDAHLVECEACRADLAEEHVLMAQVASIPLDVEQGFAALRARVVAQPALARRARPAARTGAPGRFFGQTVTLGWAVGAQAAALVLMVGVVAVLPRHNPQPTYKTLGAPPQPAVGNMLVIFKPDLTERDMQTLLDGVDARVVDGPSASHAWVLRVAPAARVEALKALHDDQRVLMAEPVDAGN
jgi:hypothetical protein